jgi:hypothetical protein
VRQSALPVVEFLLENEITSLDMEVGPYPEAPLFHKCPLARLRGEFPFLVDSAIAKESTIPMLDYLLVKGFDINKKVYYILPYLVPSHNLIIRFKGQRKNFFRTGES